MTNKIIFSLLAAALILPACASRGGPPDRGDRGERGAQRGGNLSGVIARPIGFYMVAADADRDSATSRTELEAAISADWASFGGRPSAMRFQSWSLRALGSTDAQPSFLSFDSNFDGVISEQEFNRRLLESFVSLDKNADGLVMRDELVRTIRAREDRQQRGDRSGGGQRGGGGERPPQRR